MTIDSQNDDAALAATADGALALASDDSFGRLLADAQGGSPDAVEELIRSVRSYLLLVANEELARDVQAKVGPSDLVQSALVAAQQHLDQFQGTTRETLVAWVRAILRHEITAAHRRYLHAEMRSVRREVPREGDSHWSIPLTDDAPTPCTAAIEDEQALALRRAVGRLPDDYRRVVMLRNWDRLPFKEIAEQMGRSEGAVTNCGHVPSRDCKTSLVMTPQPKQSDHPRHDPLAEELAALDEAVEHLSPAADLEKMAECLRLAS